MKVKQLLSRCQRGAKCLMLSLMVAWLQPGLAMQDSDDLPFSYLSSASPWDGLVETINILFGNSCELTDEELEWSVAVYSREIEQTDPTTREHGLLLLQRACCNLLLLNTDAAHDDMDAVDSSPYVTNVRREGDTLYVLNLQEDQMDLDQIYAELNLYGYKGRRDDVELIDQSTVAVRAHGFDLIDQLQADLENCPCYDQGGCYGSEGGGCTCCAMPINPPMVGAPPVGGMMPPGQGGIGRKQPQKKMSVAECKEYCCLKVDALRRLLKKCSWDVSELILASQSLEVLLFNCKNCCASGLDWEQCIKPIQNRIDIVNRHLRDKSRY